MIVATLGTRSHTLLVSCLAGGGMGLAMITFSVLVFRLRRHYRQRTAHHATGGSDSSKSSPASHIEPFTLSQQQGLPPSTSCMVIPRRHTFQSIGTTLYEAAQEPTVFSSTNPPSTVATQHAVETSDPPDVAGGRAMSRGHRRRHEYGHRKPRLHAAGIGRAPVASTTTSDEPVDV